MRYQTVSKTAYSYRSDPAVPSFPDDRPIIVFDGHCSFCAGWVQFALRHDRHGRYAFLPAQSPLGEAIYKHYGLDPTDYETSILIADGLPWFAADGALRIAAGLGLPWSAANVLRILPSSWLAWGYDRIAANRIRWFGRREACLVPPPEFRSRFLA